MKGNFKLDPMEQKLNELIEAVKQIGEPKTLPPRSNHPLDLLSGVINASVGRLERLVKRLVSHVIKPRKWR